MQEPPSEGSYDLAAEGNGGSIINISSLAGLRGTPEVDVLLRLQVGGSGG